MAERFPKVETGFVTQGFTMDLRAVVATEIVKHCAMVTGTVDGEDSAGRSRLVLLPSREVATRAVEIAGALVDLCEASGWIRDTTMTPEDEAVYLGRLQRVREDASYKGGLLMDRMFKDRAKAKA